MEFCFVWISGGVLTEIGLPKSTRGGNRCWGGPAFGF